MGHDRLKFGRDGMIICNYYFVVIFLCSCMYFTIIILITANTVTFLNDMCIYKREDTNITEQRLNIYLWQKTS